MESLALLALLPLLVLTHLTYAVITSRCSFASAFSSLYHAPHLQPLLCRFLSLNQKLTTRLLGRRLALLHGWLTMDLPLHLLSRLLTCRSVRAEGAYLVRRSPPPAPDEPPSAVLFFVHGGGFSLYTETERLFAAGVFSTGINCRVYAADYPLCPSTSVAHILDVVTAQYEECVRQNPGARIVVAGDSAGGWLALSLLLRTLESDALPAPDGTVLVSPWLDVSGSAAPHLRSALGNERSDFMSPAFVGVFADAVARGGGVGEFGELLRRVRAHADGAGLGDLLIAAGGGELMADEGRALYLAAGGSAEGGEEGEGSVELYLNPGGPHDFCMSPVICGGGLAGYEEAWRNIGWSLRMMFDQVDVDGVEDDWEEVELEDEEGEEAADDPNRTEEDAEEDAAAGGMWGAEKENWDAAAKFLELALAGKPEKATPKKATPKKATPSKATPKGTTPPAGRTRSARKSARK
jgi:acetyl esterase/lipase